MDGLVTVLVIFAGALVIAAFSICGHLSRIADAIEAQNEHYGIGKRANHADLVDLTLTDPAGRDPEED